VIRLENVSKSYDEGESLAVNGVSLEVGQGEVVALIGESGCGKSTLLKMVNRLVSPTDGAVYVNGNDVAGADPVALRRNMGYVFQDIGLFPHYTVSENVAAVPRLLGWSRDDIDGRVGEILDFVGLPAAEYGERAPAELSGGQQQRVGVARALAARPDVVLMDEPFGALDPITRASIQDEFDRIQTDLDLTVLMVTHDMTEAMLLADRIAVMKDGELSQIGTPSELLQQPSDDYVESLVGIPKERADRLEALIDEAGPSA
jgi:osmoprotectant transport system ATP-binding protein